MVFPIFDLPVTKNIASIGVYYSGGQLFGLTVFCPPQYRRTVLRALIIPEA